MKAKEVQVGHLLQVPWARDAIKILRVSVGPNKVTLKGDQNYIGHWAPDDEVPILAKEALDENKITTNLWGTNKLIWDWKLLKPGQHIRLYGDNPDTTQWEGFIVGVQQNEDESENGFWLAYTTFCDRDCCARYLTGYASRMNFYNWSPEEFMPALVCPAPDWWGIVAKVRDWPKAPDTLYFDQKERDTKVAQARIRYGLNDNWWATKMDDGRIIFSFYDDDIIVRPNGTAYELKWSMNPTGPEIHKYELK